MAGGDDGTSCRLQLYHLRSGKLIKLPRKKSAYKIAQIGGQVIWETAQSVDECELPKDGRYLPKQVKDDEGEQAVE